MANTKYIKQPPSTSLVPYMEHELRKIEKAIGDHAISLDALEAALAALLVVTWIPVTFQNSWVDFGAGWQGCAYTKDVFGFVHVRGLMKNGVIGSASFTLPAGFRPSANLLFPQQSAAGTVMRVDVSSSGAVATVAGGGATNGFVSTNFSFHAS